MTHVCVGKKKSVGGWDEKIVNKKKVFGDVSTRVGEKMANMYFLCVCVFRTETLSGFSCWFNKKFLRFFLFFPKVFLSVSRVSKSLSVFRFGFLLDQRA